MSSHRPLCGVSKRFHLKFDAARRRTLRPLRGLDVSQSPATSSRIGCLRQAALDRTLLPDNIKGNRPRSGRKCGLTHP
jgi:hypothetical protein